MTDIVRRIFERVLSKFAFHAWSPCEIVAQDATDWSIVSIRSARFGDLRTATLLTGLPGLAVRVAPSTKALVCFEGGDQSKPIVSLMRAETKALEIKFLCPNVTLGVEPASPALRVADTLNLTGTVNGASFTGTATVTPGLGSLAVKL